MTVNSDTAKQRAAAAVKPGYKRSIDKKKAYLICTVLAAVFIIAAAVVLRGVSDKRVYNDYMKQAQLSYYSSDFDSALAALRKAAAIEKTEECLLLMADCYETQGNYTKALEVLRQMDMQNAAVSARISSINSRVKILSESEKITIAGKQFAANASSIVLDNMGLDDSVFNELAQMYSLESLSLSGNHLRNVSALAALGGLTTLNLSNNQISDLSPLASLSGLRTLYIDNNPALDLSPLYSLANLTSLSIKGIQLKESQLKELSKALPSCAIHSEAAAAEMTDISFGGVTFKSDVTELDLSGMGIRDISALSGCLNLTRLNLSGNEVSDLSPLMNIPNLAWLDISANQVSDLKPLIGMKSLVFLNAAANNISGTSALTMMGGLKTLYLDENQIHDFSGLRKLRSIVTLGLNGTGLTDPDLQYLMGLSQMLTLNIENNSLLSGEAVDNLAMTLGTCTINHSELTYVIEIDNHTVTTDAVSLSLPRLGIVDISNLTLLRTLQTVDLSGNFISNIYPLLYSDSRFTITYLDLSINGIYDIMPLSGLACIEYLDLSENNISSELPLLNLASLRTLILTGNPLTEEQVETIRYSLPNCNVIF